MSPKLALVSLLLAHAPGRLSPNEPFVIEKPAISYALFGEFVTGEEVFVIKVNHATRFGAPLEIFVPHQRGLEEHRPAWALVGPGLPPLSDAARAALPSPLPEGFGAVLELNQESPREVFFESVMRRFFWSTGALAVVLPRGESEVWIWSPAKTKGKFGLGYGVEEGGGYLAAFDNWSFYAY